MSIGQALKWTALPFIDFKISCWSPIHLFLYLRAHGTRRLPFSPRHEITLLNRHFARRYEEFRLGAQWPLGLSLPGSGMVKFHKLSSISFFWVKYTDMYGRTIMQMQKSTSILLVGDCDLRLVKIKRKTSMSARCM